MSISKELMDAINNKDVIMVKIILKNNMLLDPSFALYDETSGFVQKEIVNLYDSHDGEAFKNDLSMWTKDYLDGLMVDLMNNFSKERVEHIRNVCSHIYGENITVQEEKTFSIPCKKREGYNRNYNQPNNTPANRHENENYNKQIGIGLAVGGTVVAGVGVAVSKPIIIGVGALVAIVGGVMIATDK